MIPQLKSKHYTSCMHGLDEIGWDYGFSFESYGVNLGVRSDQQEALDLVTDFLPWRSTRRAVAKVDCLFSIMGIADEAKDQVRYNLYSNHELIGKSLDRDGLQNLFAQFADLAVAELAEDYLFVHSGVVEWNNACLLLPGHSRCGKSTLVAELLCLGATYLSDEYAVIDPQGMVRPYPRPISLRNPEKPTSLAFHNTESVFPSNVPGSPINLIAFCDYKKGSTLHPEAMTPAQGLIRLLENTHSARRDPARALKIHRQVVSHARILMGTRGEASHAALQLLQELVKHNQNQIYQT